MKLDSLRTLWIEEMRDLYSAENQLLKALPKMAKKATTPELKEAFETHLEETQGHVDRLEEIFSKLAKKPGGKTCKAMKGLIEEGSEVLEEEGEELACDAALIAAAQKVEHYEIAGYGSAVTFAKLLGDNESARLLAMTLDEEERADKKLTAIAESTINIDAASGADDDETRSSGRSNGGGGRRSSSSSSRRGR